MTARFSGTSGVNPPPLAHWKSDARLLLARIRRARRLDLRVARALGRPLPDRLYLQLGHLFYFGRWPDLEHPRTLNEHIIGYLLRCRDPLLQMAADKMRARRYIAECAGAQYLVPLLGAWRRAQDVPLESLQRPYVLKPSAASGMVLFVREGDALDAEVVRARLRRWLRVDYSRYLREWMYHDLPQTIMAERMLGGPDGALPADYKLWVIGGRVRFIHVDRGRFAHHTRNLYLPDWRPAPARLSKENHPPDPRPAQLEKMVALAERLAEPFEFLRVDCYLVDDLLFIGELTSSPGAGFERFIPESFALELGRCWRRRAS